jgi:hypothetical protein
VLTGVRRLKILPCSESWSEMRSDGADGARWCARCEARVNPVAELDAEQFEALVEQAAERRVCVRVELDRGRPKLASGRASAMVLALSACASTPDAASVAPIGGYVASVGLEPLPADRRSEIVGFAVDARTGEAIDGAFVILEGDALTESLWTTTDEHGMYGFANLPAGRYVVSVDDATMRGLVELPEHTRARASFGLDVRTTFFHGGLVYGYEDGFTSPGFYLVEDHSNVP